MQKKKKILCNFEFLTGLKKKKKKKDSKGLLKLLKFIYWFTKLD